MKSPFIFHCLIPFHLADPAGILFFGNAFTLFHQAYEHFVMNQLDYSWPQWFQSQEWIIPICHAEAQYLKPLYAGQECEIKITVHSISHSSFVLNSSIYQPDLNCSLKTVHVLCDRNTKKKIPIPQELKSKLETA